MSEMDACRLPQLPGEGEHDVVLRLLKARRIAVIGLSPDPSRPSHDVASFLLSIGCEVVPVNPSYGEVLGRQCYASLQAVPGRVELVNVFRRPEHCVAIVQDVIAVKAGGIWLQQGIVSSQARDLAASAGIDFVQDRCLKVDHLLFAGRQR